MPYLKVHQDKIDPAGAEQLQTLCPFGAITLENGKIIIGAGCRMCRLCVKNGPAGAIEYIEDAKKDTLDKTQFVGITVFVDHIRGEVHPVTMELIGKARELARVTGHPVNALMLGSHVEEKARTLLSYGVDTIYVYDYPELETFNILPYTAAFSDYIKKEQPSAILVGATNAGRSLAPRVAARFRTGLTADCTVLEMKENTDLVQIRPAFGGNIMAQIITTKTRPQLCTVRYKIFSAPEKEAPHGTVRRMTMDEQLLRVGSRILDIQEKPKQMDISEADCIVAVGRGVKSQADLSLAESLADKLGAQLACTRPLIEAGWFDARRQIGLSGRTVKPRLLVTLGISGSVQFAAGMCGSDCIIAVNSDPNAPIFDVAHYGFVGDLYEIIPQLLARVKEAQLCFKK